MDCPPMYVLPRTCSQIGQKPVFLMVTRAMATAAAFWIYPGEDDILSWWGILLLAPTVIGMAAIYSVQVYVARDGNWRAAQDLVVSQACFRVALQLGFAFIGLGAAGIACAEASMRVLTAAFGLWRTRSDLETRIVSIPVRECHYAGQTSADGRSTRREA